MAHIWGINWQAHHTDDVDFPHIQRMGYKAVLLYGWMWDNADFCNRLMASAPADCIFILRDHPLSEQKSDMYTNPAGTGKRHAREWAQKFDEGRVHIPRTRCWVQGINEPDSNHAQQAIDIYTTNFVYNLADHDIRCAGWVFGTGHPSTVNLAPSGPVDWHWYADSARALLDCSGVADFHAYGSWNQMPFDNHLCRMETCPYELPAIFTETGIDEGIVGNHGVGYKANFTPTQYMLWLDAMQMRVRERLAKSKLNLHAMCIFTYDFGEAAEDGQSWETFDVRACRPELEATRWSTPSATPGNTTHLPLVGTPGPTPPTSLPPEPQPPQYPAEFVRAINWLLPVEGGYTDNDEGAPANYGINQAANPDIVVAHLTRDGAIAIYYERYWLAAGCNAQDWPLSFLIFDSAVQHGVGRTDLIEQDAWRDSGPIDLAHDDLAFMGARLQFYAQINEDSWQRNGRAWMRRMGLLLTEAARRD